MRSRATLVLRGRGPEPNVTNAGSRGTRWAWPGRHVGAPRARPRYFPRPGVNATAGYETKWYRLAGAVAPMPRSRTGSSGQPTDVA